MRKMVNSNQNTINQAAKTSKLRRIIIIIFAITLGAAEIGGIFFSKSSYAIDSMVVKVYFILVSVLIPCIFIPILMGLGNTAKGTKNKGAEDENSVWDYVETGPFNPHIPRKIRDLYDREKLNSKSKL